MMTYIWHIRSDNVLSLSLSLLLNVMNSFLCLMIFKEFCFMHKAQPHSRTAFVTSYGGLLRWYQVMVLCSSALVSGYVLMVFCVGIRLCSYVLMRWYQVMLLTVLLTCYCISGKSRVLAALLWFWRLCSFMIFDSG